MALQNDSLQAPNLAGPDLLTCTLARCYFGGMAESAIARLHLSVDATEEQAHDLIESAVVRTAAYARRVGWSARAKGLEISPSTAIKEQVEVGGKHLSLPEYLKEQHIPLGFYDQATEVELYSRYLKTIERATSRTSAARRERLRGRQCKVVGDLLALSGTMSIIAPRDADDIGTWLPPKLVGPLRLAKINTIGALLEALRSSERWYDSLDRVGEARAITAERWARAFGFSIEERLAAKPLTTALEPRLIAPLQLGRRAMGAAPLDPDNRGVAHAFQHALTCEDSDATVRSYAREVERFYLWCKQTGRDDFLACRVADANHYVAFLASPLPEEWLSDTKVVDRDSASWKPFSVQPSPTTISHTIRVLRALFTRFMRIYNLDGNPFEGVRQPHVDVSQLPRLASAATSRLNSSGLIEFEEGEEGISNFVMVHLARERGVSAAEIAALQVCHANCVGVSEVRVTVGVGNRAGKVITLQHDIADKLLWLISLRTDLFDHVFLSARDARPLSVSGVYARIRRLENASTLKTRATI